MFSPFSHLHKEKAKLSSLIKTKCDKISFFCQTTVRSQVTYENNAVHVGCQYQLLFTLPATLSFHHKNEKNMKLLLCTHLEFDFQLVHHITFAAFPENNHKLTTWRLDIKSCWLFSSFRFSSSFLDFIKPRSSLFLRNMSPTKLSPSPLHSLFVRSIPPN